MTTMTGTGTDDRMQAEGAPGTCRYPGCASPARGKDPAAPGPRPGYCEQVLPGAEDADVEGVRGADVVTRKGPAAGVAAGRWW